MRVNNMSENRLLTDDIEVCKLICSEAMVICSHNCKELPVYKLLYKKAFAAGEQAQKEKNRQEIASLQISGARLRQEISDLKIEHTRSLAEAEKIRRGMCFRNPSSFGRIYPNG